ncbi:DMT family transporter [Actinoallomurus rhizosphaericola]|uniref:DMT family transporter n=1 Tax=Actinoallomurus rhizosphaericola TaxID=2952536 RepID=UPI00209207E4|nr:DMT family transporter [Actinoallomurus rhizosphaericola]MCO5997395.1 DMT family transporter [Actinoallomurus rhizosphaericola]
MRGIRGGVGAATAMFCVGTLTAVSPALHHYPVYGGQAIRYAVGALLLMLVARFRGIRHLRLSLREVGLVILLALTGLAAFNVFIVESTRYADPATVGTIVATVPIVLAVVGPFMEGERPRRNLVAAAVVVASGAAIATGFGGGAALGLLLALGALGGEVGFSLLALPLLPRLGAIRVSAYSAVAAVPLLLITGLVTDGRHALRVPTASEAGALGYLAVVVTAFAFFCWYDALPRLGPERAGLFSGFLPVGAIVSTMVLGTGHPSWADVAGAALVIAGLLIGLRTRRPDGSEPVGPVVEETAGRPG